ncbi:hypothetical protein TNCV_3634391 [Trichonephila clavipes]|nr:hypothetical protein TNCV_3634391 [Trichonephila clavipes]
MPGGKTDVEPFLETTLLTPHFFLLRHPDDFQPQLFLERTLLLNSFSSFVYSSKSRSVGVCGAAARVICSGARPAKGVAKTAAPWKRKIPLKI